MLKSYRVRDFYMRSRRHFETIPTESSLVPGEFGLFESSRLPRNGPRARLGLHDEKWTAHAGALVNPRVPQSAILLVGAKGVERCAQAW
jgi:hypothetical protein